MTNAYSIKSTLLFAIAQLKEQGFEARILLQHVLNVNHAWLIAHENDVLQANAHEAYRALINRRVNGEPIAYILGYSEFYGLKLKVSVDTLIPRADTETLAETALVKISPVQDSSQLSLRRKSESNNSTILDLDLCGYEKLTVLDLGTGSGAIALAIAKHRPQAHVTAVDASQAALDIAIENAQNLEITNVKFVLSNWFSALSQQNNDQKFDVMVGNPPYIEANDVHLNHGDLRFEPLSALAAGEDGMDAIRHIIKNAPQYLNPHGWLMLEHGYNQADKVAALLKQTGFSEISHVKDLAGINRVTIGSL